MQKKEIDLAKITKLLDKGADANAMVSTDWSDITKMPIIFLAIERDDLALFKLLLAKGADVNRVDSDNHTILQFTYAAARKNHGPKYQHSMEIFKELLSRPELELNAKTSSKLSFIENMVIVRNKPILELLLNDPRIDLTAKNKHGDNLLDMNKELISQRGAANKNISKDLAIKELLEAKGLKASEQSSESKLFSFSGIDSSLLNLLNKLKEANEKKHDSKTNNNSKEQKLSVSFAEVLKTMQENGEKQAFDSKTHDLNQEHKVDIAGCPSPSDSDNEEG